MKSKLDLNQRTLVLLLIYKIFKMPPKGKKGATKKAGAAKGKRTL
jgi:hypothetical protein